MTEEFLKERGINPIEPIYWDVMNCDKNAKETFSRIELKELLEAYARHLIDESDNFGKAKNRMDINVYQSYSQRDAFIMGWHERAKEMQQLLNK